MEIEFYLLLFDYLLVTQNTLFLNRKSTAENSFIDGGSVPSSVPVVSQLAQYKKPATS